MKSIKKLWSNILIINILYIKINRQRQKNFRYSVISTCIIKLFDYICT